MDDLNQATVSSMADLIQKKEEAQGTSTSVIEVKFQPLQTKWTNDDLDRQTSWSSQVSTLPTKKPWIAPKQWKLAVFLAVLFVVIVTGIALVYHFYIQKEYQLDLGRRVHFDEIPRHLEVYNEDRDLILSGSLGMNLPGGILPYNCFYKTEDEHSHSNNSCVGWKDFAELRIKYNSSSKHVNCYHFSWTMFDPDYYPEDCFDLGDSFWYGGILPYREPFHEMNLTERPFLTSTVNGLSGLSSVIDPYWLTSKNMALFVEGEPPLFLSVNERHGQMCLSSKYANSPYLKQDNTSSLNYTICTGPSLKTTHEYVMSIRSQNIKRDPPPTSLFSEPIYSTWAQFKDQIDQETVLSYVQSLSMEGLAGGTVYLQEGWQIHHGDMEFDPEKFPNATGMVATIRGLGFDVGLAFTHMVATDSQLFQTGVMEGLLVKDAGNSAPGLVQYWKGVHSEQYYGGFTAALDVSQQNGDTTNMSTIVPALSKSLANIRDSLYISKLDFEGGQTDLLPYHPNFKEKLVSPNLYTKAYDEFAQASLNWAPLQSAYKCQSCDIVVKLYDFNSESGHDQNGLAAVLPTVISLSLMGYPFIIPGPIGGSSYVSPPSKDLFIRWMQITAFLPVMHFSIPPEAYDSEVVAQAKELMALHNKTVVPEIEKVLSSASDRLVPIIRPLWWYDDTDHECIWNTDQFMVGDSILVAPVLSEGKDKRDVYLPRGTWRDGNDQKLYIGPMTLQDYAAVNGTKPIIPYFLLHN